MVRFLLLGVLPILILILDSFRLQEVLVGVLILHFVNEIFIRFKLMRFLPEKKVSEVSNQAIDTLLFSARVEYDATNSSYGIAKNILAKAEGQFFAEKVGGIELQEQEVSKESILQKASEIVLSGPKTYISTVDLVAAYLLLTEPTTKFLAQKDLSEKDIINIVYWTRHTFHIDNPASRDIIFQGIGFGESFVYGWHYEIKKYATDLTIEVLSRKTNPSVIGRKEEYDRMIGALSKQAGSNVLLIGEPGTGKNALVEFFAYNSHIGTTPREVTHKKVYTLHVDQLLSGVQSQGDLTERLSLLFSDITHSGNAIIYIPTIENIFGGGGLNFDVSGVLYDYIKNTKFSIIGSTTPSGFKSYIEKKEAIMSLFETIRFEEPSVEDAIFILCEKVAELQEKYRLHFTYAAIQKAVELSSSYLPDSYLPGKAITLLEDVASVSKVSKKTHVTDKDIVARIEQKTNILISSPDEVEKDLLLHLEDVLKKQIIDQDEAVITIANALRRVRSGFKNSKRPIATFLFLGPTGVGKTESARVLSNLYFKDDKKMIRLDMSEYQTPDSVKRLLGGLPGEDSGVSPFIESLKQHPFSLVLLDEFEKAYPKILDLFLQVFEEGVLTDNQGRKVSFINTIIIATSNAGSELIRERMFKGEIIEEFRPALMEYLQRQHIIRPELLNRFDDVVMFKPLSKEAIRKVAGLLLNQSFARLSEQQIEFSYEDVVITKIIDEGYNYEFGARNVRRYIEKNIESYIATLLLEGKIAKGEKKILSVDSTGNFLVR